MLMKHITDPQSFVDTLPVGYSSGNPNNRRPQILSPATFSALSLTALAVFFVVFGFFVA